MNRPFLFAAQLALTLLVAAFLVVPVLMSMLAGVTVNFFQGISSGLTLRWVWQVLDLYADTLALSLGLALACLACTLVLGVPAAYALAKRPSRLTRLIEEMLVVPVAVPRHRAGIADRLWRLPRVPHQRRLHPGRPCAVHPAFHDPRRAGGAVLD